MVRIQYCFYFIDIVVFFIFYDVVFGKYQIVNDRGCVGLGFKKVIIFEERVVIIVGMGDYQSLYGYGVFFYQIGDVGVGVDNDFIGQIYLFLAVMLFVGNKVFIIGLMVVIYWYID